MSVPVPVTTLGIILLGHACLDAYARCGTAVSAEAKAGTRAASAIVRAAEDSQTLFGAKAGAISRLHELANECEAPGWDGAGAAAVEPQALRNAEDFLRALPPGVPLPEIAAEPDGSISFDWIQSRHRLFSLSVGSRHRLAYAWLDGTDRGHGVDGFDGTSVPPRVLFGIQSVAPHRNASVGIA